MIFAQWRPSPLAGLTISFFPLLFSHSASCNGQTTGSSTRIFTSLFKEYIQSLPSQTQTRTASSPATVDIWTKNRLIEPQMTPRKNRSDYIELLRQGTHPQLTRQLKAQGLTSTMRHLTRILKSPRVTGNINSGLPSSNDNPPSNPKSLLPVHLGLSEDANLLLSNPTRLHQNLERQNKHEQKPSKTETEEQTI